MRGGLLAALVLASLACGGAPATAPPPPPPPPPPPVQPGPPASLAIASGNAQVGQLARPLPAPLVLVVKDAAGLPVPGKALTFQVTSGGGLAAGGATTNADGKASVSWVLGPGPGPQRLVATVTGTSLTATCDALARGLGVPVDIVADDWANRVYAAGDLLWRGSFAFDPLTRALALDATWSGPSAALYDDGPWTEGGHEPVGEAAGDHRWGLTAWVVPPSSGVDSFAYGLVDHAFGDAWVWTGPNGTFDVLAGQVDGLAVQGMTFAPFGTTDVKLVIDTGQLAGGPWGTSQVQVLGSAWLWLPSVLHDDGLAGDDVAGDGRYTFQLSEHVGAGKEFRHAGLLYPGAALWWHVEFDGSAYADPSGAAYAAGLAAYAMAPGATAWTALPLTTTGGSREVRLVVP